MEGGLGDPTVPPPQLAIGREQAGAGHEPECGVLHGSLAVAAVVVLEHAAGAVGRVDEQHRRARQREGDEVPVPVDRALEVAEQIAPDGGDVAEHVRRKGTVDGERGEAGVAARVPSRGPATGCPSSTRHR